MDLNAALRAELAALEENDLRRHLRAVDDPEAPRLNFAGNDYLGLAAHPALVEAACRATRDHGAGAGASRLVTGTRRAVLRLEETRAAWEGTEAALLFGSGYAAAVGTLQALAGPGDTLLLDKLCHASLIDGARLSGATLRVFPHRNLNRLEELLRRTDGAPGRRIVVTESVFSMDGDTAPLRELVELKERHGAWLMVDEAHATGLYGAAGAGLLAAEGLGGRVEITLATLSKALGGAGGVIAGSRPLVDWLVNRARSFVYSTAPPPGVVAAGQAAVELARGAEGETRRARLRGNVARFRAGLPAPWGTAVAGPIQPLICGGAAAALRLAQALRDRGFLVPAIRYPTVPRQAARLRVTLTAAHAPEEIDALLAALRAL